MERHGNVHRDRMRGVCWGCLSLIPPPLHPLVGQREPSLKAQCGLFPRLSGNATITDHRPSKTRVALGLQGDKQPAIPSQCIDPSHNLHYWERKYCQLPTNKHLPISREGIAFFFQPRKENTALLQTCKKGVGRKDKAGLVFFSFFTLSHLLLCLSPSVSLWPLGAALPLI